MVKTKIALVLNPAENETEFFGSLELDKAKFPEIAENATDNAQALKSLTDRIKSLGCKGLCGCVRAKKSPKYADIDDREYWISCLKDADTS